MAVKKIRIHELAKRLGMTNVEVLNLCGVIGVAAKGPSSSVAEAYADMVARRAQRDGLTRDKQPEEPKPEKIPAKKAAAKKTTARTATEDGLAARTTPDAPTSDDARGPVTVRKPVNRVSYRRARSRSNPNTTSALSDDSVRHLIAAGESDTVEFKQTARVNLYTGDKHDEMEAAILKTIDAFLNTKGGTLIVGVADDGQVSGIEVDLKTLGRKQDRDGFELWLGTLISEKISVIAATKTAIKFEMIDGKTVCSVKVERGNGPSYVKSKDFYARVGNQTRLLDTPEVVDFTKHHWS